MLFRSNRQHLQRPITSGRCSPRFTAAWCQTAEASAELEVRHPIPEHWSAGPAATVFLGVPEEAGGVRHPVDESKTKPTYSASTIAASVIPAHGPPRCRRPRPNQDRPPSAPAAQTRLSAAAHRVPGRLHHLVDHGHGWACGCSTRAGGWLPGGDAIGGADGRGVGKTAGAAAMAGRRDPVEPRGHAAADLSSLPEVLP